VLGLAIGVKGRYIKRVAPPLFQKSGYTIKLFWWVRFIFYHYPVRIGCLVGDLPAHDWHHFSLSQSNAKWTNAIIEREKFMNNDNVELWGLYNMVKSCFFNG